MYNWDWGVIYQYKLVFLQGALVTIGLTLLVAFFGTLLGIILGLMRRSEYPVLPQLAKVFIEIFRALPILVLLIWIYYVMPILFDIKLSAFAAAFIALTVNLAAYVAETVRAGITAIPRHQFESGITLGLSPMKVMFIIILPQSLRNILPNLLGLYIAQLKNSSLVSIISVGELLHRANLVIGHTYRPLEVYTTVALIYLAIILPLTFVSNRLEKKLSLKTRNI